MRSSSPEPIRRPRRRSSSPKTNSIANIIQILSRSCGTPWKQIRRKILGHPKHKDPNTRPIVRDRLATLVCGPRQQPKDSHWFRVDDVGRLVSMKAPAEPAVPSMTAAA